MDKNDLANRLLKSRGLPPIDEKNNGSAPVASSAPFATYGDGKLAEAGQYLKAARTALLTWVWQHYRAADNVDRDTDQVIELLDLAQKVEDIRCKVDVKSKMLGG